MDKYIKTSGRDVKKAIKNGDQKAANRIQAGRTFVKFMQDNNYFQRALTDAAIAAKVKVGKDFTYKVVKNEKTGFVDITVNGKKSSYTYYPELKKNQ